ncbi:MAG: sugar phosphate isomerase/epimerase [Puniceicoccaceae bacterium]|nr:MAG: sugar phosphate isomerase/epimerase [Puniceicoccaceae bacterium]
MPKISFMSANFVAREVGYTMTQGWGEGDAAAVNHFRPEATFRERFAALLDEVRELGFDAIDLWTGHLGWAWATERQIETARELLAERSMTVPTLAGGFGNTPEEFRRACRLGKAIGAEVLGGGAGAVVSHRKEVVSLLNEYDLILGLENHPEKTASEMRARVGDPAGGRIGVALDTGWFGTQGYPAAKAIGELSDLLVGVHLKDIHEPKIVAGSPRLADSGHETCALGDGVVGIEDCIRALKTIDFKGPVCIEHEPEDHDPREDCRASRERVRKWWSAE